MIGTNPAEWWPGDAIGFAWGRQIEEPGGFELAWDEIEAWEVGAVGRASARGTVTWGRRPDRLVLQAATAYSRHWPGTPLRSRAPRSAKVIPEPITASLTVWDTSTSLGSASAPMRAPI